MKTVRLSASALQSIKCDSNDDFVLVEETIRENGIHDSYLVMDMVFKRESDDSFFIADYVSYANAGDYFEAQECQEVIPKEVTTTIYLPVEQ